MNISLKSFLETGKLGELQLGMSSIEVIDLLGPPDSGDVTLKNTSVGQYWQYGTFMISFGNENNQIEGVATIEWLPMLGIPHLPAACSIVDWGITVEMSPPEVNIHLQNSGLKFRYRSSRGYYARKAPLSRTEISLSDNHDLDFITYQQPKNQANYERVPSSFTFFLQSKVRIYFSYDNLIHIGIF